MTSHLLLGGGWVACDTGASCKLKFHVPMGAAELAELPQAMLLQLFEAVDPPTQVADGVKVWRNGRGEWHRDYDLPAIEWQDGTLQWFRQGLVHRDGDKPAVIDAAGTQVWYQHGEIHRDNDLPASVDIHGNKAWYQRGELHRDGAPAIIQANGASSWYILGVAATPWQALRLSPLVRDESECDNCRTAQPAARYTR